MSTHYLVLGMAKTGTTALFYGIKKKLPATAFMLFEPNTPQEWRSLASHHSVTLTKSLLTSYVAAGINPEFFAKIVVLVRDPRDQLLSRLLYWAAQISKRNENLRDAVLAAIIQKEIQPRSTSFIALLNRIAVMDSVHEIFPEDPIEEFSNRLRNAVDIFPALSGSFVLKYEHMVDGNIQNLREYLVLEIDPVMEIPHELKRVARSKRYGEWKQWFLPSDLEILMPLFKNYMDAFGYAEGQPAELGSAIDSLTSSEFIQKSWGLP
jgi:hypothetical protein